MEGKKLTPAQRHRALMPVRAAIRGWAFAPDEWLPDMIRRAEEEKDRLTSPALRDAAEECIKPLRRLLKPDHREPT
jgi:hypothetical protein